MIIYLDVIIPHTLLSYPITNPQETQKYWYNTVQGNIGRKGTMCYNYIGGSLFTRSRPYSLFHALIHLFTYPVISPSLNLSLISPLRHSDSHLFRHIVTRSLNSTLIHSLVHTLIHSLSQSLIHSHNKFLESYQRKLNGTTTLLGSNFK